MDSTKITSTTTFVDLETSLPSNVYEEVSRFLNDQTKELRLYGTDNNTRRVLHDFFDLGPYQNRISHSSFDRAGQRIMVLQKTEEMTEVFVVWEAESDNNQGPIEICFDFQTARKEFLVRLHGSGGYGDDEEKEARKYFTGLAKMSNRLDSLGRLLMGYQDFEYDLFYFLFLYSFKIPTEKFDASNELFVVYQSELWKKSIKYAGVLGVFSNHMDAIKFAKRVYFCYSHQPIPENFSFGENGILDDRIIIGLQNHENIVISKWEVMSNLEVLCIGGTGPYNGHTTATLHRDYGDELDRRWFGLYQKQNLLIERIVTFINGWKSSLLLLSLPKEILLLFVQKFCEKNRFLLSGLV